MTAFAGPAFDSYGPSTDTDSFAHQHVPGRLVLYIPSDDERQHADDVTARRKVRARADARARRSRWARRVFSAGFSYVTRAIALAGSLMALAVLLFDVNEVSVWFEALRHAF